MRLYLASFGVMKGMPKEASRVLVLARLCWLVIWPQVSGSHSLGLNVLICKVKWLDYIITRDSFISNGLETISLVLCHETSFYLHLLAGHVFIGYFIWVLIQTQGTKVWKELMWFISAYQRWFIYPVGFINEEVFLSLHLVYFTLFPSYHLFAWHIILMISVLLPKTQISHVDQQDFDFLEISYINSHYILSSFCGPFKTSMEGTEFDKTIKIEIKM